MKARLLIGIEGAIENQGPGPFKRGDIIEVPDEHVDRYRKRGILVTDRKWLHDSVRPEHLPPPYGPAP
jgi:hypothetical protein